MKRPLAIVALLYVAGIVCGAESHVPLLTLFAAAIAAFALSVFVKSGRPAFILSVVFFCGWINTALRVQVISPEDLRAQLSSEAELVTVRGKIVGPVSRREYQRNGVEMSRCRAQIDVDSLRVKKGEWHPARGRVIASTTAALSEKYFAGQPVEVQGAIHVPDVPIAPGLFDYKKYLERQDIYFQLDAKYADDWQLLPGASDKLPIELRFLSWAQDVLQRDLPEQDNSLRLMWAMTLGWRPGLTDDVSEPFMRSGTMHIFAISGLHVALISGILVALLRVVRVPRTWCCLIVIPILWFYTAATGWQASAVRSTVMMTIIIAGWALKRPPDLLNSLGASAFIILIFDPQQLFQASFQLSFFVVLSLGLLIPPFEKLRQKLMRHDPLLPDELRPRWKRFVDVPLRFLALSLVTSLAAWLGSLPLVALYFHLLTPVSLLANMLIVPLSSLALMANLGSLLCAAVAPFLTGIFNHAGWFFMREMVVASEWFANAPGAFIYVREPSVLECVLYYALVFGTVTAWFFIIKRKWIPIVFAVFLIAAGIWHWNSNRNLWRVTVIPLSGGESVFVDGPANSDTLLIDCGNESAAHYVTIPFLHAQGVNALPAMVLTHGDLKNVGATTNIIEDFAPKKVLMSPVRFRSHTYRVLSEWLESTKMRQEIKRDDSVGTWSVLHPAAGEKFSQADDGPVVLRGKVGGVSFLLLSDLSRHGQELLLERTPDLKADVVIAGLPRESEPLGDALLERIAPKLIVVTDAIYPSDERASVELRRRLRQTRIPVLFCREVGAVTVVCRDGRFAFDIASR